MQDKWNDEDFFKSSLSGVTKNLCVEVAIKGDAVAVRNSTAPDLKVEFTADEWEAFVGGVKKNEFDL
ncbi:DUF397 domain-containing protein [Loktanella sp. SALINAS62]|uniref:DUF397 domain-containing protein n=1 Tax=Loktanella sp. SALINAS62 TaxID=2706124 RepID=UPI001B8B25A9|nr:DUF397 domain-containing protein [Loktanella sp. SALINAS62]MBS1301538.1 DUF397 domain-containing protein [Loktanella sp. SALINAS62]